MRSSPFPSRAAVSHATYPLAVGVLCCALIVLVSPGCGENPKPAEKFEGVNRVSANGAALYMKAKQQYGIIRALDLQGPQLAKAMDAMMAQLDGAVENDPKCPLFVGKRGEMFVELGPDSHGRAEADLPKALALSEDWVPAWIGLADLEARRGQYDKAGQFLKECEKALETLAEKEKKTPAPSFKILGLTIGGAAPEAEKDPRDPSLDKAERRQLLLLWLMENEQFSIDSPGLLTPAQGGGMTVNRTNVIRRLRARLAFEWIVLRIYRNESPESVLPYFDHVFEWDPDLFPARIEKAVQLRRLGRFREAERLLRPYVDSNDPKLANNSRLLHEMANVYTDWYVKDGAPTSSAAAGADDLAKQAAQMFARLHKVNPQHAAGWISRAHFFAIAGERGKNPTTIADARQWLENAKELMGGAETPEWKKVKSEVDQAERSVKAGGTR